MPENRHETLASELAARGLRATRQHHIALGAGGPHFCLGAHLARLEGRAVLDELAPLLPRLELTEPPARLRSNFFNGIKHLKVRVH